ncbi:MAG TPA: Uma2 family endonuclease [Thermoanaerobaculia bacterium]|nr:Uma2 family endonuclease [Thermoanaerobaculia bacterium]
MPSLTRMTDEEYLALERQAETKSELRDGVMVAMSGASYPHNRLTGNLVGLLWQHLKGRSCGVCPSDMRVYVPATGLDTYPDASVVCGEPELRDGHMDTLLNPVLLIEVLSPSTEAWDRGGKLEQYRTIPSLAEVLLVSQKEPRIEQHVRAVDGWTSTVVLGLESRLALRSLGLELDLAEVYDKVPFGSYR